MDNHIVKSGPGHILTAELRGDLVKLLIPNGEPLMQIVNTKQAEPYLLIPSGEPLACKTFAQKHALRPPSPKTPNAIKSVLSNAIPQMLSNLSRSLFRIYTNFLVAIFASTCTSLALTKDCRKIRPICKIHPPMATPTEGYTQWQMDPIREG